MIDNGGEQSQGCLAQPMPVDQPSNRVGPEQRSVPVKDQQVAAKILERGGGPQDGVTRSEWLVLHDEVVLGA